MATTEEIQSACAHLEQITCVWVTRDEQGLPTKFALPDWFDRIENYRRAIAVTPPGQFTWNRHFLEQEAMKYEFSIIDSRRSVIQMAYPHIAFLMLIPTEREHHVFWNAGVLLFDIDTLNIDQQYEYQVWDLFNRESHITVVDIGSSEATAYADDKIASDLIIYRNALQTPTDSTALEAAITRYRADDPEGLVPAAEARLIALQAKEKTVKAAEDRDERLASIQRQIAYCKAAAISAQETIQRERRIAAVSGYENVVAMRQAGETIVYCEDAVPAESAEYRKLTGRNLPASPR